MKKPSGPRRERRPWVGVGARIALLSLVLLQFVACDDSSDAPVAPDPATPDALVREYAAAITLRSREHFEQLHVGLATVVRPEIDLHCPPGMTAETCLPWVDERYWTGEDPAALCWPEDLEIDAEILAANGDTLTVRLALLYKAEHRPDGSDEAVLQFQIVELPEGFRIQQAVDVSEPRCR